MSKEKKKTVILTCILVVIAAVLIGFLVVNKLKENGTLSDKEAKQIVKDFEKYFNSKEKTVIYYASTECGWCSLQTPILETIAEDYDMDYLYVDTAKLSLKQKADIAEKLDIEGSTPTTVIVKKGKVVDTANGFTDARDYVKFFSSNGLIPKDAVYSKDKNINYISLEEFDELTTHSSTKVVVIGQTTCSHCINVKPALNSIAEEYKVQINYININLLSKEEYSKFISIMKRVNYDEPDFVEKEAIGTPTIIVLNNSKVSHYIAGERTKSQLVREFKKAGVISE